MTRTSARMMTRSRWFVPVFSVGMGVAALAAAWAGGQPSVGVIALGIMTAFALLVLVAGRSETVRGLRGDGRDERFAQIDLRATAAAGLVLISVLIVRWLVEIACGHSGGPYDWLCAIGGLAYLLAVVVLRWRG
jgi:hypothetical protein